VTNIMVALDSLSPLPAELKAQRSELLRLLESLGDETARCARNEGRKAASKPQASGPEKAAAPAKAPAPEKAPADAGDGWTTAETRAKRRRKP